MAKKHKKPSGSLTIPAVADTAQLVAELRTLIDAGKVRAAQAVNTGLIMVVLERKLHEAIALARRRLAGATEKAGEG